MRNVKLTAAITGAVVAAGAVIALMLGTVTAIAASFLIVGTWAVDLACYHPEAASLDPLASSKLRLLGSRGRMTQTAQPSKK